MNKKELLDKVKSLEGLSTEEKAYLINLVNTKKKYGLVWEDKQEDVEEQLRTHLPVLKEVKERAIINDTETEKHPNHILIEGDNLHALTSLTFTHEGKIDLIYIDPPYNTGEKDFRYNDTYVDKEDAFRHSKWLSFMDKRLQMAKKLLSDTGVFICHIDENEYDNLSVLLKEVFNEQNNLGTIIWNKKNPKGDAKGVANMHEYIYCYAKNKNEFLKLEHPLERNKPNALKMIRKAQRLFSKIGKTEMPEDIKEIIKSYNLDKEHFEDLKYEYDLSNVNEEFQKWLKKSDFSKGEIAYKYIDEKGKPFQPVSMAWPNNKPAPEDYFLKLKHPLNKKFCPIPDKGWRNPSSTMQKLLGDDSFIELSGGMVIQGEITFTQKKDGTNNQPRRKYLLEENLSENIPSIFEFGASDDALLKELKIVFPYVKPVDVAKYLIKSIHPNPNILLDFFAGTGPALHATMAINEEENRNITCITATNNENNIADDCYKRNKLVINGYEDKKGKVINDLTSNNLRYYQTDFVERETTLKNKRKLTQLSTELLCIKEDCYIEVTSQLESGNWHKFFTNGNGNYVYVIYDDIYIEDGVII